MGRAGVWCSFTPIRGRQVRAGTPSPSYPTQSPPPAGFLVWLDYLEKSEASSNSSGFGEFWESVESIVIPVSTPEAASHEDGMCRRGKPCTRFKSALKSLGVTNVDGIAIADANQEKEISLHPVESELFGNSSMTYRHPVMVAG